MFQGNKNFGNTVKQGLLQQLGVGQFIPLSGKKHKKHHNDNHNPPPLDPGRGDGRVPVDPVTPTSPLGPGYVWVGDHWERAKAPLTSTPTPTKPGFVWVGDHWERVKANPNVRDHRNPVEQGGSAQGGVIVTPTNPLSTPTGGKAEGLSHYDPSKRPWGALQVRDHTTGAPQGGVTVTTVDSNRDDVIGVGASPVDKVIDLLTGKAFEFKHGQLAPESPAPPRDHRTGQ
jgi:hypothetical protein